MKKLLEMKNIEKRFPGVYALKGVNIDLYEGEVHALLGENGAGKSTLMKVLNGIYHAEEGEIYVNEEKVDIKDINDAKNLGIGIIHQELVLVPDMTIMENIYLGKEIRGKYGFLDKKSMYDHSQELLDNFDMDLRADRRLGDLTIAQQQMIEIIKAVSFNSKIIVMDEPTSSLTENEVEFLFKTIEKLRKEGVGIIYISHRLEEIFEISNRISVLRDGQYVGTLKTSETNADELISMMVGRELTNFYIRDFKEAGSTILSVEKLNKSDELIDINFDLRKGEILGFSGLVGAGRSEVMKCIFGIDSFDSGKIIIDGKDIVIKNPNDAVENGIAYVPESRASEGLFLIQSVNYNNTIRVLDEFIKNLNVDHNREREITEQSIKDLSIVTPSINQQIGTLSGGNQQKVLISRWLLTNPKILILDEPTRGIDVGAKSEIYSIMNALVETGVSIIMVSSDLPEVINMSDRVVVMANGEIQKILRREEISQEKIMYYATGGK